MRKKWLLIVPVAVVAGALVPLMGDGWDAPCACLSAKAMFAGFVGRGILAEKYVEPEIVASGLSTKFPAGTKLEALKEHMRPPLNAETICKQDGAALSCQYWLEKKGSEARGYEVVFSLSRDETVTGISARQIHRGGT